MNITHWADTSAILHWKGLDDCDKVGISPITVSELEHIKTSKEDDKIKFTAREAIRAILNTSHFETILVDNHKIDKMLKKYEFLSDINDHRILCAAELTAIQQGQEIIFLTCDATQYLFALQMPHLLAAYSGNDSLDEEEWAGWEKYTPSEEQLNMLYTSPNINILGCKTNEFARIYEGNELKDILFWTGSEYRPLKYKDLRNPYIQETISPRNLEQKMAFDLLQN